MELWRRLPLITSRFAAVRFALFADLSTLDKQKKTSDEGEAMKIHSLVRVVAMLIVSLAVASPAGATPPVPVETVTGCVKDGWMLIQAPERFKREKALKINPCTNIPFDVQRRGKQIRARRGIDLLQRRLCLPQGSPDCRRLQAGPG
jgi:hypothetical protein